MTPEQFTAYLEAVSHTTESQRMLDLLENPRCFGRDLFEPGHFTGSALVVSRDLSQVLLNHHRFLDKWLQFGGHCDGDPDLSQVALREAEEESGLAGLVFLDKQPVDLDIHMIPANPQRGEPAHEHFDVRFLLKCSASEDFQISHESISLKWFNWQELQGLELDPSMQRLLERSRARLTALNLLTTEDTA